ncbi:carbohydrate ABC transporter permease [Anaeromassilibacillus senegalensis]|uniref:carbohydrate ABC transporter permease n=1 Tax=Anaeromassilibacillus senegalensis TaxID=1673717 RepID=UPI00068084D8|nr:sugar ABC transporter permease [Anaeromassilibacillus senegalensis]
MKRDAYQKLPFRKAVLPWLFLGPSLLCVSIFVVVPFVDAVRRSFFSAMSGEFVGTKNYEIIFQNKAFQLAGWNTIRFTLLCIPALILLSLALALLVHACKERRGIFKTSFLIPMAIPVASIVLIWKVLFHENGLLNKAAVAMGGTPIDWLHSSWAFLLLIISYLWKNSGYDMVLWLSGISSIPGSLFEAAQVDGANAFQTFFRITLPNLKPTLFTITVLSLLNSFKVFREAYLVAGDYPDDSMYMLQHLFNNWFLTLDIDKMCAAATVMAVTVLAVILILQFFLGRSNDE